MYKLSPEGATLAEAELPGELFTYKTLKTDAEGRTYVESYDKIIVLDADLKIFYGIDIDAHRTAFNLIRTADGGIIVEKGIYTGRYLKLTYYYFDHEKQALAPVSISAVPENVTEIKTSYSVYYGEGYDIFYRNQIGVYCYNEGDESAKLLCDWVNSGLYVSADISVLNYTNLVSVISKDVMVCVYKNPFSDAEPSEEGFSTFSSSNTYDIIVMTRDPDTPPKIVITLAYNSVIEQVLLAAIDFNHRSDKYRVVFKDYTIYNTPENWTGGRDRFNMDIIRDDIPDIAVLDGNIPYYDYIDKGMFADLYVKTSFYTPSAPALRPAGSFTESRQALP